MKEKKKRNGKRIINLASAILIFMFLHISSNAQEIMADEIEDIVIVLDCSQSMSNVDSDYMSVDFIRHFICAVPSYYRVGIVAYDEEVIASCPIGSSMDEINRILSQVRYKKYGNAGAGLLEAVSLFEDDVKEKRIIIISDGENLMKTAEQTEESRILFENAVSEAKSKDIEIDILNVGKRIENEINIYSAAGFTGGVIYDLEDGNGFANLARTYMFQDLKIPGRPVGKISGTNGELRIKLPDSLMESAKVILTGPQCNENFVVNCEAENIEILKGKSYTVLNIEKPISDEVGIQISSELEMDVDAYLTAEYTYVAQIENIIFEDLQQTEIIVGLENQEGNNLLSGHLADGGISVFLNGHKSEYQIRDKKIILNKEILQDEELEIEILFEDPANVYYGNGNIQETVIIPVVEEEEQLQIDWFFWTVIAIFIVLLLLIFFLAGRNRSNKPQKIIEEREMFPKEKSNMQNDFYGKILVYVVHNREDIDYPPESINLFARCNREMITLDWILDTCNLPLQLSGADKIIFKPGEDRSLVVKNNSKASALKGRELLAKGHFYHLYYHEKVTFIFDQEDTEIEVHYKDLKPNER